MNLDPITVVTQSCDPNMPLPADDDRYVSLAAARGEPNASEGGLRVRLANNIRRAKSASVQLISGFTGDGKTTELLRLVQDLKTGSPKVAVIYVDCGYYLNPYEYSFNEILFAIIAETGRQLKKDYAIDLDDQRSYLWKKWNEFSTAMLSEVELKEVGGSLWGASAKIGLKARDEDQTRKKLSELLQGDRVTLVTEFARTIDEIVRPKLSKSGYVDLVIIVDWLEKLVCIPGQSGTPNSHEELFLHHAAVFQSFGAHVILTLPIDMVYSAVLERLKQSYGSTPYIMSGVRVADNFSTEERQIAEESMIKLLTNRFAFPEDGMALLFSEVFPDADPELPYEMIRFSGGHPRQLLVLMRECCSYLKALPITREAFLAAKKANVHAAGRRVRDEWFPRLAAVHREHDNVNDDVHLEMLRTLCIFQYANGEPTYAVDPAILPLKKMKKALEEYDRARVAKH